MDELGVTDHFDPPVFWYVSDSANGPPAIHARQVQVLDQEGAIL